MKRKKIIWRIFGVTAVLAAIFGIYLYREFYRTHKDTLLLKPDFSMAAPDLVREFEKDETASNHKYWDKVLKVDGMVKNIVKDDNGFYSVVLGDTASLSSVRMSMDSIHNLDAATLQKGQRVSLKGICTGFNPDELLGSDVILVRSVIDQHK